MTCRSLVLLSLLTILLLGGCKGAQTLFEGVIYDDFGSPLPGVRISFDPSRSVTSASDGKYDVSKFDSPGNVSMAKSGYVGRTIHGLSQTYWEEQYGNFQLNALSDGSVSGQVILNPPPTSAISFELHHTADNGLNPMWVTFAAGESVRTFTLPGLPPGGIQVYASSQRGDTLYMAISERVTLTPGGLAHVILRPQPVTTASLGGTLRVPSDADSFAIRVWGDLATTDGVPGEGKVFCSLPATVTGTRFSVRAWFDATQVRSYAVVLEAYQSGGIRRTWVGPVALEMTNITLSALLEVANTTGSRTGGFTWASNGADFYLVRLYRRESAESHPLLIWTGETAGGSIDWPLLPSNTSLDLSGEVWWQLEARRAPGFDLEMNPYWDDLDGWSRTALVLLAP